jgi:anaerobic selenocysteine-containing dehydrogenase
MEHDDIYQAGGQQHILLGPKIIDPPEGCRSNHDVICALAKRLGAQHPGFDLSPRQLIDQTLQSSGWGTLEALEGQRWIDCQPDFRQAHYLDGFAHSDGRFHFAPDWSSIQSAVFGPKDAKMPALPDHWDVIESATDEMPFRLVTAPARHYLNSTFTETPTSSRRHVKPTVMICPDDAKQLKVDDGDPVRLGNGRGELTITTEVTDATQPGVVIVESIWPNDAFTGGKGINVLTGADPGAPVGGAAFHDNRIWIRRL